MLEIDGDGRTTSGLNCNHRTDYSLLQFGLEDSQTKQYMDVD